MTNNFSFYPVPINQVNTRPKETIDRPDVISCKKCGCSWLEKVLVQQWSKQNYVVLGQNPAPIADIGFWIYRCPKCNELYEPPVNTGAQDAARKLYDSFLDQLEAPLLTIPDNKGDKV